MGIIDKIVNELQKIDKLEKGFKKRVEEKTKELITQFYKTFDEQGFINEITNIVKLK